MKDDIQGTTNQGKARVAILISDKLDFIRRNVTKKKKRYIS